MFVYVEDDQTSREVMDMTFRFRLGMNDFVIWENSQDFALKIDDLQFKPTVFFLDIHMKPLDGFGMLQQIRQNSKFDDVMVIALTASVMSEEIDRFKSAGFDSVIAKPIDPDTFPALVQRILKGDRIWNIS